MILNTSVICLSLKYINKRYELICNVSKWIYFELTKLNYKESKFIKSLDEEDFEIIEILIKFVQRTDLLSDCLIYYCRVNYSSDIIKLLIDNGANVHEDDDFVLKYASKYGFFEIAKLLIINGANIHAENNRALYLASFNGHIDIVKLLIDNGANIHADDKYALRYADINGHNDIVKLLIDNGADKTLVRFTKLN